MELLMNSELGIDECYDWDTVNWCVWITELLQVVILEGILLWFTRVTGGYWEWSTLCQRMLSAYRSSVVDCPIGWHPPGMLRNFRLWSELCVLWSKLWLILCSLYFNDLPVVFQRILWCSKVAPVLRLKYWWIDWRCIVLNFCCSCCDESSCMTYWDENFAMCFGMMLCVIIVNGGVEWLWLCRDVI